VPSVISDFRILVVLDLSEPLYFVPFFTFTQPKNINKNILAIHEAIKLRRIVFQIED
jgi:hypothetical protein